MEKIDARKLPPEALEHIRRQAFVLRKQGYTWTHISEVWAARKTSAPPALGKITSS